MRLVAINGLIASCGLFLACSFSTHAPLAADVEHFIERRDNCDHFRGEEPYDQDRRAFLQKQLREFCTGTDRELAKLKQKYQSNATVTKMLDRYEPQIER